MGYHRSFFGMGSVTATTSASPAQAVDVAIVRGASVEFKSTEKPLKGSMLAPVDSATTDLSITGKISMADFSASMVQLVVPGTSSATGRKKMAVQSTVVPTTPFQITVTNSANFATDLGVINLTDGVTMKRVTTATNTGEYSVSAGVYTFVTGNAGDTVQIRYVWSDATTGSTLTATNQAVGATSGFGLYLFDPPGGTKDAGIYLPSVKFPSLSLAMKSDDWTETGLDFTAYTDATGNLFYGYGEE